MADIIKKSSDLVEILERINADKNISIKQISWMTIGISGADPQSLVYPEGYYFSTTGRITNKGNTSGSSFQAYDVVML